MKRNFISLWNDYRYFLFAVKYSTYISPWLHLNSSLSGVFGQVLSEEIKQNNLFPAEEIPILQVTSLTIKQS